MSIFIQVKPLSFYFRVELLQRNILVYLPLAKFGACRIKKRVCCQNKDNKFKHDGCVVKMHKLLHMNTIKI